MHLNADGALARSVELGREHALPLAEDQFAAGDLQRHAVPEQHGPEMCVGVVAVAIRVLGVVVHPLDASRHRQLEKLLDFSMERGLILVDEQGTRRVERPEADEAFFDR